MTEEQIAIATALGRVTYLPATAAKRFARNMASVAKHMPEKPISDAQDRYMRCLAWTFRRQMPQSLVPAEKPS